MSDIIIGQLIQGIVTLISLVITILLTAKVKSLGTQIDGQQTKLLEAVQGKAQAQGELKGQADKQAEVTAAAATTPTVDIIPKGEVDVNIKSLPENLKL